MINLHSQSLPAGSRAVSAPDTPEDGGGTTSTGAGASDAVTERWTSVFHSTNGWMHAPPGSHFQRSGETIELVGAVHRCGRVWYATSISKLGDNT
jgi:hypothetical protein